MLNHVFAVFQRRWRRERVWQKLCQTAAEKEKFEAANAEAAAVCSLDGYRRRSRHDSKQRMVSDLALSALKLARKLRRKARSAPLNSSVEDSSPKTEGERTAAVKQVPLFRAIRRLSVEQAVSQVRKKSTSLVELVCCRALHLAGIHR